VRVPEVREASSGVKAEEDSVRAVGSVKEKADPVQTGDLRVVAVLAKSHPASSGNNHQAKSIAH